MLFTRYSKLPSRKGNLSMMIYEPPRTFSSRRGLRDGSILVSDDFAGALHRIWTTANRGTDRVRFVRPSPVICSP